MLPTEKDLKSIHRLHRIHRLLRLDLCLTLLQCLNPSLRLGLRITASLLTKQRDLDYNPLSPLLLSSQLHPIILLVNSKIKDLDSDNRLLLLLLYLEQDFSRHLSLCLSSDRLLRLQLLVKLLLSLQRILGFPLETQLHLLLRVSLGFQPLKQIRQILCLGHNSNNLKQVLGL